MKNKNCFTLLFIFISILLIGSLFSPVLAEGEKISYSTHCQDLGWLDYVSDGALGGTTGSAKRMEALKIRLDGADKDSGVTYRAHVEDYGWMDPVSNDQLCGTTGEAKRVEAIQINLTGPITTTYDVYYRTHIADYGWLDWAKNNESSGSAGLAKRMEAVEIRLVKKGSPAPGPTTRPFVDRSQLPSVSYSTHVENIGWMEAVADGAVAGTTGRNLQVEALQIQLARANGGVEYKTHVENIGWMDPVSNGTISGTTGQNLQVEAITVNLTGDIAQEYDIYYRSHITDAGWLGWAKNGEQSGSSGGNKSLQALQIQLVTKGGSAPGSTDNAFIDYKTVAVSRPSPSTTGALQVQGNQLVSQSGRPVQLRGISTHGLSWFPSYVNQALISELRNQWNADVLRLAMYTAESGGYCTGGDKAALKALVTNGVNYAQAADMYAIIDWHILSDSNPMTNKADAIAFFDEMSANFADRNNVIYEICNEPNGGTDWGTIKSYALEVIPVIKAHDPDAVIIVGTPTWSQEVDKALADPITGYSNIMYALHFYAGTHKDDLRNRLSSVVSSGLPVFVTEFGTTDASGNGAVDVASANQWVDTMNSLGVSYVCWNLSNKNESSALINSNCSKTSGFSASDLTQQGQWLLGVLASPGLTGTPAAPQTPQQPSTPSSPSTSGGTSTTINGVSYTLTPVNSWESDGMTFIQYSFKVRNESGQKINSWSVHLTASGAVAVDNIWNAQGVANAADIVISNVDYNGSLENGAEANDIGFIIKCAQPFSTSF